MMFLRLLQTREKYKSKLSGGAISFSGHLGSHDKVPNRSAPSPAFFLGLKRQQFYFYKIYDKKRDGTGNMSGAVEPV
jgi:hypothetical protein